MSGEVMPGYAAASAQVAGEVAPSLQHSPGPTLHERGAEMIARLLAEDWLRLAAGFGDGVVPAAFAWRCSYGLHHLGRLQEARDMALRGAEDDQAPAADQARVQALLASVAWNRGDGEACAVHIERSRELATGDPSAEAHAWVARGLRAAMVGDRDENLRCYDRALALARRADDVITEERILNNLASAAIEEGRFTEAVDRLTLALEANERTGHHSGLAVLRHNLAEALYGQSRLDEALVEAAAARAIWAAIDSPSVAASSQIIGDIQAARGNAAQAAIAYREAIDLAEVENDVQTLVPALAGLATVTASVDPDAAADLLSRLGALNAAVGSAVAPLATGWLALQRGDIALASQCAETAAEQAGRHRELPRLAEALELAVLASVEPSAEDPRLREAAEIWERLGTPVRRVVADLVRAELARDALGVQVARDQLHLYGVHDDAVRIAGPVQAARARRPAPGVRVQTLGRFAVFRCEEPVPSADWPSRKAREALAILAGAGETGVSRPMLGTLLWPEATEIGNRLSVALSHLRAVLDPDRAHSPDHFVLAGRDNVRLNLEQVAVDLIAFERAAAAALESARRGEEQAIRLLEAAAAMHSGDFLQSEPTEEWTAEIQERVDDTGRELVQALARLHIGGSDPDAAVPWLARLLAMDPYDEPTYREVIAVLWRLGRYGESRRFHRTYAVRMRELGVPVSTWEDLRVG